MNAYVVTRSIDYEGIVNVWVVAAETEDLALDFIHDTQDTSRYDLNANKIYGITVNSDIITAQEL